jgi:hypothetical protein
MGVTSMGDIYALLERIQQHSCMSLSLEMREGCGIYGCIEVMGEPNKIWASKTYPDLDTIIELANTHLDSLQEED